MKRHLSLVDGGVGGYNQFQNDLCINIQSLIQANSGTGNGGGAVGGNFESHESQLVDEDDYGEESDGHLVQH